jgi:hypothetical protein
MNRLNNKNALITGRVPHFSRVLCARSGFLTPDTRIEY